MNELVVQCLELMNRAFVAPGDAAAAEREFYHQYRKLWDRGIPVGLGLGHLILRSAPGGLRFVQVADSREESDVAALKFRVSPSGFLVQCGSELFEYDLASGKGV
jgi:hypothetical protein